MARISIFLFIFSVPAHAADKPQPLPAAVNHPPPPAAHPVPVPVPAQAAPVPAVKYNLRNLRPVGLSGQSYGERRRELLQFTNEQGKQSILYEELSSQPTVKEITRLAPFLASSRHTCSIDLECKAKAFCTDNCRSLYYELSNSPADPALADKSNCVLRAFSCLTETQAQRAVANQPEPAVAPAPAKGP